MVGATTAFGECHRLRVAAAVAGVLLVSSLAFLLGSDLVLGPWFFVLPFTIAAVAGAVRAGWLASAGAMFAVTVWRFAFPPLVGLLRGSHAVRYTVPSGKTVWRPMGAELRFGIGSGIEAGILLALTLGTFAYLLGVVARWFEDVDAKDLRIVDVE